MQATISKAGRAAEFHTGEGCFILELSNTPGDPECSIARARVPPGVTTKWHRLRGIVERYVILDGSGLMEAGDLPACEVNAGDVVLIPASTPQRITNTGGRDLLFLAVCTPRFKTEAYEDMEPA